VTDSVLHRGIPTDRLEVPWPTHDIDIDQNLVFIDRDAFKAAKVNADSVLDVFAKALRAAPGVARVDRFSKLLADTLRDRTARTTLISMLYQSSPQAEQSCREHEEIVAALAKGEMARAERLMRAHIGAVEAGIDVSAAPDPLEKLREALKPVAAQEQALGRKRLPKSPAQETRS